MEVSMRASACLMLSLLAAMGCGSSSDAPSSTDDSAVGSDGAIDTLVTNRDSAGGGDTLGTDSLVPPGDSSTTTDTSPADVGTDAPDPYAVYPAGPFGSEEGNVLANLEWIGYLNPTAASLASTQPYVPTSLQAMRRLGKGYGLVHVSEFS
jgi:hypothetical protein